MARFFGSIPGSSHIESHPDDVIQEETVGSIQQSEAAMAVCSEVKADVKNLQSEMNALKEMVASLHDKREESSAKGKGKQQRLPAGLSKIIRSLHESGRIKFEPSEMFSSHHNQEVADEMIHQVIEHHKESFSKEAVKRAVHCYYESQRRLFNDSKPERRDQVLRNAITRRRGFQKRLYERRAKMLKTDAERVYWKQINQEYMSEESQDEDSGTINRHRLTWTSQQLQKIKTVLDKRISARNLQVGLFFPKERVESTPSDLPLPKNPVKWAVKRDSRSSSHDQCENTLVDPDIIERPALHPSQSDGAIGNQRASHMEGFVMMPLREHTQRSFATPRRELTRGKDVETPCRYGEVQSRRFRAPVATTTHRRDTASPSQSTNLITTRRANHIQSFTSVESIFDESESDLSEKEFY